MPIDSKSRITTSSLKQRISRRELIKLGVALTVVPPLPEFDDNLPTTFRIVRPEDLFEGVVIFHGVTISKQNPFSGKLIVKPKQVNESGMDLLLPPQHLLEEAFREDLTGTFTVPKRGEARAWFSIPSRLSFVWTDAQKLNLTPSGLLAAISALTPRFKSAHRGKPKEHESWIEPITRLVITPTKKAAWKALSEPRAARFNPVWAIQLQDDETDSIEINLIWTPEIESKNPCKDFPPDCPDCVTPLSSADRCDLVSVFSGDKPAYKDCPSPAPAPPKFSPLILSSQGSFLKAEAGFDAKAGCGDLVGWTHSTSHGRDHYVEVIRKYFCYPDGIPITVIKESARHFEAGDNHEGAGAFIRIRLLVQRTKESFVNLSSEMPFVSEVIPEQELPPIDLDAQAGPGGELLPHSDGWVDPGGMKWKAFWPLVRGQKLKLKVLCTDHTGSPHEVQRSFILVSNSLLDAKTGRLSPGDQSIIDAAWEQPSALVDRSTDLHGQSVAVAPPGKPNDTTITAYSLDLARAAFGTLPPSAIAERPFEPRLHRLTVTSDCLSSLSGSTKPLPVSFRRFPGLTQDEARQASLTDKYKGVLTPEVVDIPGQPYLGLEAETDSGIGNEHARRFGGMVQPNVKIAAVGRETELVAGDVQKYLKNTLLPADLFSGAKLLGGIDLGSVLKLLPKQPPGWVFERSGGSPWDSVDTPVDLGQALQNLSQNEQTPDTAQTFVGWRATFDWSTTELKPFLLFSPTEKTALSVHSEIAFAATSGKANWQSQATLRDFDIAIPNADSPDSAWIIISFDDVSVSIQSGQAPLFAPRIKDGDDAIRFGKQLAFLDALRKLLKSEKGLSIDVTGSYVAIRQITNIGDKNLGAFSITGLTFTFGIRLPFTGDPLEAEFALGSISNPFAISVSGYSGAGFFQTIVTSATQSPTKVIAVSLEFGGDYAANFGGIAKGRAFLRAGLYFRKDVDDCVFRGFVRTGGHLDILSIGGVTLLAILSLECSKSEVTGKVHVEITISIGWFQVSKSFDVVQKYSKPSQTASYIPSSNPQLMHGVGAGPKVIDVAYQASNARQKVGGNQASTAANSRMGNHTPKRQVQSVTHRMSLQEWRDYWNAFVY
jgi:hypothetical protein